MNLMIDIELLAECRDLALAVAPELSARPLYVCDSSELSGLPLPTTDCTLGFANPMLYPNWPIADRLGDRWQGPGSLIALNSEAIADAAQAGQFARCVRAVAIHEVAHLLPVTDSIIEDLPDNADMRTAQVDLMARRLAEPDASPGDIGDVHGHQFIRRAVHLYVRAALADIEIPIADIFSRFGQSHAVWYLHTLFPEAVNMQRETFATIENTSPPAAFTELWESDLQFMKGPK